MAHVEKNSSESSVAKSSACCEASVCAACENNRGTSRHESGDGTGKCPLPASRRRREQRRWKAKEEQLRGLVEWSAEQRREESRGMWEEEAEKKLVRGRVWREVERAEAAIEEDLERRRDRLSDLLSAEDETYLRECRRLDEREERASKSARMLERYLELRTRREEERQGLAEEKREQQFKRNCEELRSSLSHRLHLQTSKEGKQIYSEKKTTRRLSNNKDDDEEALFRRLWARDEEEKRRREEDEERDKRRKGREWRREVEGQVEEKREEKRRRELMGKEEEAEMRAEQNRLLRLESECNKEAKRRVQEAVRRDLDACLETKVKLQARAVQEELVKDAFFHTRTMEEEEERERKAEEKRSLMREQKDFLQYQRDLAWKEGERRKEVDEVVEEEAEKVYLRRLEEREQTEKAMKGKKTEDEEELQKQMMEKMERLRHVQCANKEYAQKVISEDKEDKRREEERKKLTRERNERYQKELEDQIRSKQDKLEEERRLLEKEQEQLRRSQEEEQERIRRLVAELDIDCPHPYRVGRKEAFGDCGEQH